MLKDSERKVTTVRKGIHDLDATHKKAGCGENRIRLHDRQETSVYGIVVERNRTVTIVLSC